MGDIDISELSQAELKSLQNEIQRAIQQKRDGAIVDAYQSINEVAKNLGLKLDDLIEQGKALSASKSLKPRKTVSAKYRNEDGEEWTGRGKPPKWFMLELEKGKTKEDLLIN